MRGPTNPEIEAGVKPDRRWFLEKTFVDLTVIAALGLALKFGLDKCEEFRQNPPLIGKDIPPDWLVGKLPLENLDVANNPDLWVGENGERLSKKLTQALHLEYGEIYSALHQLVLKKENYDLGGWKNEETHAALDKLITDLAGRGKDIVLAKTLGFDKIQEDLNNRYYELASYVQMLIKLISYKNKIGLDQFSKEMYASARDETIGWLGQSQIEKWIDRNKIYAVWNYLWSTFSKGETVLCPVGLAFATDGFELNYKPYIFEPDVELSTKGIKPPINRGEQWYTNRPNRVKIFNFDPEVEALIRKELRASGIERGINSLTIEHNEYFGGITERGSDTSSTTLFYPEPETLNVDQYRERERELLHNLIHEGWHTLSARRTHLSTTDRMRMREWEQEILAMADPLSDLEKVFNPQGEMHGMIQDNEHSVTQYYLENLLDLYENMGLSAKDLLHEFRGIIAALTGEDIFSTLWMRESDEDMNGLFKRLEKDFETYNGATKLIAQTLSDHRKAVLSRRRIGQPKEYDAYYFTDIVIPLVFTHLILYKPEEVAKSLLPEALEKDKGLVANYMASLYKRMRAFTRLNVSEELLAELFAAAMLTRKYGRHETNYVNEAKPIFNKILALLRENDLAASESPQVS